MTSVCVSVSLDCSAIVEGCGVANNKCASSESVLSLAAKAISPSGTSELRKMRAS